MDTLNRLRRLLKIRNWSLPERLNQALHKSRYMIALLILVLALPSFLLGTASLLEIVNFFWLRQPFTPYAFLLEPLQPIVLSWRPPFGALLEIKNAFLTFPYVGEILFYLRGTVFAFPLSYIFVVLLLVAVFKVRRFWCRFCPTGISIAAINRFQRFRRVPFLRLNKNWVKCTKCGICKRVCPVQVTEVYEKNDGDMDTSICILCLRCIEMCPQEGCLSLNLAGFHLCKSRNWLEPAT
jgi:ferredoxin